MPSRTSRAESGAQGWKGWLERPAAVGEDTGHPWKAKRPLRFAPRVVHVGVLGLCMRLRQVDSQEAHRRIGLEQTRGPNRAVQSAPEAQGKGCPERAGLPAVPGGPRANARACSGNPGPASRDAPKSGTGTRPSRITEAPPYCPTVAKMLRPGCSEITPAKASFQALLAPFEYLLFAPDPSSGRIVSATSPTDPVQPAPAPKPENA